MDLDKIVDDAILDIAETYTEGDDIRDLLYKFAEMILDKA